MTALIYGMIYLGSALMVFNIFGFIRFARKVKKQSGWKSANKILYVPIVLLALFLAGYLAVGIFGKPDLIIAAILFGGSIFVSVMYFLLDRITDHILEKEHLEAKLMAAEESSRAKTEFLSWVSHEMRTPLNVILGLCTLSGTDPALSPETRDRIEKTGQSAEQLLGIVNNIIDLNSLETGEFMAKTDVFSLDDVLRSLNGIIRARCDEKGLTYEYICGEEVCDGSVGDDQRIKQVLFNLLDNAVKYTEAPGTVRLTVTGGPGDKETQNLIFTVEDTGVGISPEFLPRIFDPFAKEDTGSTSRHGGSGLGLAVSKSIVELLGGSVCVKSEKGAGSVFTVRLPLKKAPLPGPQGTGEAEETLEGKRILIVEDVPENAEIVADLLELEGAESERAENGKVAVEMFSAASAGYYDAILMDLRMPVMDGITAAKEIRRLNKTDSATVPIIALTANAFACDVKESLNAGMNAHLSKPADSEKLYATLKQHIKTAKEGAKA